MTEIDPLSWSDLGVSELVPTGTVTLLLADVEGSTRLWQTAPEEMTNAIATLDATLAELVVTHQGVRPIEQGEGDSFVVAFARASDAVACALDLQRALLSPIRLRIGLHTGEVQLRDEGNYVGPTINRAGRLRSLAHGGQTVLSSTTSDLVMDQLPRDVWLADLGTHQMRDLPRPERIAQMCHADLPNEFPPLRTSDLSAPQHLPVHLTRFVGRAEQLASVHQLLVADRLVTLTGAGGIGKTRLSIQLAQRLAHEFGSGVHYVDLAPIADPELVSVTAARALGLPDQPGRSATDTALRFIGDQHLLIVLDNCEHILDAAAAWTTAALAACSRLTILATSREPIGIAGEVVWRVPPLSLTDEAIELFTDRARHSRADFGITDGNAATVAEICQRLDGMPLAIELAAARIRALSPVEILDSLHDRFRLLTGGARSAVRRQQTLRASVDWSHALLTDLERMVFRRLAAFPSGFDLDAARAVAGADQLQPHQVLDLLTLLVDKSLVVAETTGGRTRYRMMETIRQYALEKLGESDEADHVRSRHSAHYTKIVAHIDEPNPVGYQAQIEQADLEFDNLRAAFAWSRESSALGDRENGLRLASALQPLWLSGGRIVEGLSWFHAALGQADHSTVAPAVQVRAVADRAFLMSVLELPQSLEEIEQALSFAREIGDSGLLARTLLTCGSATAFDAAVARRYLGEAIELARSIGDNRRLSQALWLLAKVEAVAGDPRAGLAAGTEGSRVADEIGDRFVAHMCRFWGVATALLNLGEFTSAAAQFRTLIAEAEAAHDPLGQAAGLSHLSHTLAFLGDADAARRSATSGVALGAEFGGVMQGVCYGPLARALLAGGDIVGAAEASGAASESNIHPVPAANINPVAEIYLARGDLSAALDRAEQAVALTSGIHLAGALVVRALVEMADGRSEQAERDAHQALSIARAINAHPATPDALECLAALANAADAPHRGARLLGAADALRRRLGKVRYPMYERGYDDLVRSTRELLGDKAFNAAWAEGAALPVEEAIAYASRGRGERKRPASGWGSLTPAELDVVRLVGDGLANKAIAARLFVSPRTVSTHLTHVYAKLGVSSRVQLAQETGRRVGDGN